MIIYRNIDEVVSSLLRRKQKEEQVIRKGQSIWKRLRNIRPKNHVEKSIEKNDLLNFAEAWLSYNNQLLSMIKSENPNTYRIYNYENLQMHSEHILDWLEKRGFEVEKKAFSEVFDHNLMTSDISPIELPKYIRKKANQIQNELEALSQQ